MTENIFAAILNMSVTGGIAALIVMLIRLLFKNRMPKWLTYAMWSVVLLRLIIPVSFTLMFSLFSAVPTVQPAAVSDNAANISQLSYAGFEQAAPAYTNQEIIPSDAGFNGMGATNEPQRVSLLPLIWIVVGILIILTFTVLMINVNRKLRTAVLVKDNEMITKCRAATHAGKNIKIYMSPMFDTPVVSGLIRPRIILPSNFNMEDSENLQYIITHELIHIKRRDNLVKLLSFIALSLHWFNPLIWISYFISMKDMESSCDEKVLKISQTDARKGYAMSLLHMAANRSKIPVTATLLAFGESNVKGRVKEIMRYKKIKLLTLVITISLLVLAGCSIIANPASKPVNVDPLEAEITRQGNNASFGALARQGDWVYFASMIDGLKLYKAKTNGKSQILLFDGKTRDINVQNDWIYFTADTEDSSALYKIKTDGSGLTSLNGESGIKLYLLDNRLYFISSADSRLYSIDQNGNDKQLIMQAALSTYFIDGEYIYFANHDDGEKVYRTNRDGSGLVKLSDDKTYEIISYDGYVYYVNNSDGNKLTRISPDGKERKTISEDIIQGNFNIYDGWIYYITNEQKSIKASKMTVDGNGQTKLALTNNGVLYISGGQLFIPNPNFKRLNLDGKTISVIDKIDYKKVYQPVATDAINQGDDIRGFTIWPTKNISKLDLSGYTDSFLLSLHFNEKTMWPDSSKMPAGMTPKELIEKAKDPGLGIRDLQKKGITGKGVNIAIISQPIYIDNPEFKGKIAEYKDFGCNSDSSLSGYLTTGLVASKSTGIAPGVDIYYAAVPDWLFDYEYHANALDWIISKNETLPEKDKVKVVLAGQIIESRNAKNIDLWNKSYEKAKKAGILVLDSTVGHIFAYGCKLNINDLNSFDKITNLTNSNQKSLLVPSFARTYPEEFFIGDRRYAFAPGGNLHLEYLTGVLALGWQANPELTSDEMVKLLFDSAYIKGSYKIINPKEFINLVKALK